MNWITICTVAQQAIEIIVMVAGAATVTYGALRAIDRVERPRRRRTAHR